MILPSQISVSFPTAWQLTKPYWYSKNRWKDRVLLVTIVGLALGQVYISVLINKWNAAFYDTLQNKNLPQFMHQLGVFSILAALFIASAVYSQYFTQMLQIRWRRWMTTSYQNAWLSGHAYYRLQVIYKSTDNPDQRIADDIDGFISSTLSLGIGLLSSVVTLVSFVAILWGLSGTLGFDIDGYHIAIPGYMVWAALLYAIIGTWLTHKIGRPLVKLNYDQQRFEANFRYSMVRLRENVENIAFYKGEPVEKELLGERFSHILRNWWQIMKKQKQLNWFTSGYGQIAIIFPVMVAAPRYFAGAIQLGGLMQTASAFGSVQGSMSWLINVYPQFANWKATTDRLNDFTAAIRLSNNDNLRCKITVRTHGAASLIINNLTLTLPGGAPLVTHFNLELKPGDRLLLRGHSGSGKTTLLRALAGLWPYGEGEISLPANAEIMFVPQKPYLPVISMREIACYPHLPGEYDDGAIAEALTAVGLETLASHLDASDNWPQNLSPGEQQKIAFARVLLHQPDVVLLDEASSSLDEAAEARLYNILTTRLAGAIIISAGHRNTLKAWHLQEKFLQCATAAMQP
ncbi:MAG: ABC transporter ATP-binding protein/permease [Pseudomonadota bacterium]|nr:ABC transporter ATP-binding protein/permease [Pseudomonadota bacterium]MDE3037930.1 ABC transporter ATP-binding protein/permease [Pseudomonadota bacterium]